jgi:hypothetical protein
MDDGCGERNAASRRSRKSRKFRRSRKEGVEAPAVQPGDERAPGSSPSA